MNMTAEMIKQRVTIPMVLDLYGIAQKNKRRIPCPIHGGQADNFGYNDTLYNCFVCHSSGDVISLVMSLDSIPFSAAVDKLSASFAVGKELSYSERNAAFEAFKERKKAERARLEAEAKAEEKYWAIFDEWKRLSDNKRIYAPKSNEDALNPLFIEAVGKLSHQEHLLDVAEIERRERIG